jgi:hypothetical protein
MGIGAAAISDNSMFVHIRTGMDIAAGRGIPRTDPYSYTAHGAHWVVQSWLPSFTYGWLERIGGFGLVAAEQGAIVAALAWLILRLARAGSVARTIAAGGLAVGIGAPFWSQRPLLVGLLAFALTVLIVERRLNPLWLVPVVWVWVNSHGSFPLGLAWLVVVAAGAAIDQRQITRGDVRYVGGFVLGLLLAAVNPLGPRLLFFPLTVGEKSSVFKAIVEWQSPDFQTPSAMLSLGCLVLALMVLFRSRVAWRDILPVALFVGLGLFAMRNLAPMAVVMAPVLGRALASARSAAPAERRPINRLIAAGLVAVFLVLGITAVRGPGLRGADYPVAATTWLDRHGYLKAPHHIAQQDTVGGYFDLRYGRTARVFIDDRVDMFPVAVTEDYIALVRGSAKSLSILDRHGVDAVLWEEDRALVGMLQLADGWRQAYRHGGWVVYVKA